MSAVQRHQQQQQVSFNENSPRPPVPGEEGEGGGTHSPAPSSSWSHQLRHKAAGSPVLTPRRSSLANPKTNADGAMLGFEPEGAVEGSPPACLRWARHLHLLLEDSDGVELFRRYLEAEGKKHSDTLNFWFACEGLKKQRDPERIAQLVKVIYRRYFLKTQLAIPDHLRREVNRRVKEGKALGKEDVFDCVQAEVECLINQTTYPNFLRSDMYLQHVQAMQGEATPASSSGSSSEVRGGSYDPCGLATLHEDSELVTNEALPLTKDMLMATQKRRAAELRPKPEAYAGQYLQHAPPLHSYHFPYSSYNPVSRQDSELQSLSSDARTESDNMSLTDSSVDGMSLGRHTRRHRPRHGSKMVRENASLNRDPHMHHTVIPRTQRVQREQINAMNPVAFASLLCDRLEAVRRDQEVQDKLDRKLSEGDGLTQEGPCEPRPRSLADAIRDKLQDEDSSDQDILDQHVSRVWSDLTPLPSPGISSPRPKSPDRGRRVAPAGRAVGWVRHPRKDKDVFSTFSSDSGNVHDFTESSEHKHHLPKSKSMPDYQQDSVTGMSRNSRGRTSSKKTLTDATDSGVSVVSDSPRSAGEQSKDHRVLTWLLESEDKHRAKPVVAPSQRHLSRGGPAQPFVADPSMPPLPSPHTSTQLEEARRRLMEEETRNKTKMRLKAAESESAQSTLRRATRPKTCALPTEEFTTVVFSFCDEQVPYRTRIAGQHVTLRQFKEILPKKGSYRFFFKTECEDLDMRVIQEEVTNDSEVLPLWEGKVMAQVKPVD